MGVSSFITARLLSRKRESAGRVILSVSGIAMGVAVLFITLGIMDGYRMQLAKVLRATFAPIQVITQEGEAKIPDEITARAEVRSAYYTQALLLPCEASAGRFISVKGSSQTRKMILGEGVAKALRLSEGSCVRFLFRAPSGAPVVRTLRVDEVRSFGMGTIDDEWCFLPLEDLPQGFSRLTYEFFPHSGFSDDTLAETLRAFFPPETNIITLEEANHDLFATLVFQEWIMAIILGLITGVAGLFLMARLLMDVEERRRMVGILRALGLTSGQVVKVFLTYGLSVGAMGVAVGLLSGFIIAELVNLSPLLQFKGALATVYGVSSIPIRISAVHALGIAVYAMSVVLLASIIPAVRTKNIPVIQALRYE